MKKIVYYIGLDLHKETIAVSLARGKVLAGETDILAALPPSLRSFGATSARRSRKVRDDLFAENPRKLMPRQPWAE